MTFRVSPYVDLAGAMVLVGASAALGKLAMEGLPVIVGLLIRLGLAALVLCLLPVHGPAGPVRLTLRQWAVVAFQALCGVVVFNAGLLYGLERTGPMAAGIVTSATPVVMGLLGLAFFRETLTTRKLAGIALTAVGVLAVRGGESVVAALTSLASTAMDIGMKLAPMAVAGDAAVLSAGAMAGAKAVMSAAAVAAGPLPHAWNPGWGDAFLLAAVAGESVFLLARKWLPAGIAPLALARHVTLAGTALVLVPALFQLPGLRLAEVPLSAWAAVAVLGLAVTVGGYVLWFRGITRVPPSHAAAVTGILPVSSTLACWALFGTTPALPQAFGCMAVAGGIWLVTGAGTRGEG